MNMNSKGKQFRLLATAAIVLVSQAAVALWLNPTVVPPASETSNLKTAAVPLPDNSAPMSSTGEAKVATLVDSERVILSLQRDLNTLSKSAMNLVLPDSKTREQFASKVRKNSLRILTADVEINSLGFQDQVWRPSKELAEVSASEISLVEPLFAKIEFFEHFKFKFVRDHFNDDDQNLFLGDVHLTALAIDHDDNNCAISGVLRLK